MFRKFLLVFIGSALSTFSHEQDLGEYHREVYTSPGGSLPYRILYPAAFDSTTPYPLLIFLHGAYEKGTDNEMQLNIGGRFFLREENRNAYPSIIVFPQCPADDSWAWFDTRLDSVTGRAASWDFPFFNQPTRVTALLKQMLDSMLTWPFVDRSRVYIGGLSQGGMGVYDIIARWPELFAAAFPICGAGKIATARNFSSQVALWIFHGRDDDIVPVYFSRDFYRKLGRLHADVKYSEYPGVRHDSWNNAFAEKDLLPWLYSRSKKQ